MFISNWGFNVLGHVRRFKRTSYWNVYEGYFVNCNMWDWKIVLNFPSEEKTYFASKPDCIYPHSSTVLAHTFFQSQAKLLLYIKTARHILSQLNILLLLFKKMRLFYYIFHRVKGWINAPLACHADENMGNEFISRPAWLTQPTLNTRESCREFLIRNQPQAMPALWKQWRIWGGNNYKEKFRRKGGCSWPLKTRYEQEAVPNSAGLNE